MDEDRDFQALAELQERIMQQSDANTRVQQQERVKTGQKMRLQLTAAEIEALPDDVTVYRSVGKAYFQAPKADIMSHIAAKVTAADKEVSNLQQQKEVINSKLKETDNELRELVKHSPSLIRRIAGMSVGA